MEERPKSKGELVIERLMSELDPDSERYQVLASARRFKSSWVELGEKLLEVSRDGHFRQWGYDSFEDYCTREIRIRKPTAEKLTHAYRYLEKEEPQLLARHGELKPLPDYRSVDLLRQAREEENVSAEALADLRRAVLEEDRSHPTVLRRFRDLVPPPAPEERQLVKSALAAARRLQKTIEAIPDLPPPHLEHLTALVGVLESALPAETGRES